MIRTCSTAVETVVTHIVDVQPCCPASGNPLAGSTISLTYRPAGIVLPVEDLAAMVGEYVGGLGSIRAMEEMIQDIAIRCAAVVGAEVAARADLRIAPPYGGAVQGMVVTAVAQAEKGVPHE